MALENKKHDFVYLVGDSVIKGEPIPPPKGVPHLIHNDQEAERVKKAILNEIEEEKKEFEEIILKLKRYVTSAS